MFKNIDDDVEKGEGDVSSGYCFLTATTYPNVDIQVHLMILMGTLKRAMLVIDMVI